MLSFLKALFNLIPVKSVFELSGLSDSISTILSGGINALTAYLAVLFLRKIYTKLKNSNAKKDLIKIFPPKMIDLTSKRYIPTKACIRKGTIETDLKLIPYFKKIAFSSVNDKKYFIVIGDSGMGKTTFLINLYMECKSVFNLHRNYNIRFFHFRRSDCIDDIAKISKEEAARTVLLIDGFDEDGKFLSILNKGLPVEKVFEKRMDELLDKMYFFFKVIFTCRSQFYRNHDASDYETKISRLDEEGFFKLNCFAISSFKEKEIKTYLNKRFGILKIWNLAKKREAYRIADSIPDMAARPMLLGYIDFLIGNKQKFNTAYDMYETLIDKWIKREAAKIKPEKSKAELFINNLRKFSEQIALETYRQYMRNGYLWLTEKDILKAAGENNIELSKIEITGHSLIVPVDNKSDSNIWVFAHKSIIEFFLAEKAVNDMKFWYKFDISGFDMSRLFFCEKKPGFPLPGSFSHIRGGTFDMGSPPDEPDRQKDERLHTVTLDDYYLAKRMVQSEQIRNYYRKINSKNIIYSRDGNTATDIKWSDAKEYCDWLLSEYNTTFSIQTEAQWEYAAKTGHEPDNEKQAYPSRNKWGIYGLDDKTSEWCFDWYGNHYYDECRDRGTVKNPTGPKSGTFRVMRGGNWDTNIQGKRWALRGASAPNETNNAYGFRLVYIPD